MKNYLLVLGLLSVTSLFASNEKGNGGDILICENERAMLLDNFEAKEKNWDIDLEGETLDEKVEEFLKRFTRVDPVRGELLKTYLNELLEDFKKIDLSKNQVLDNVTTTEQELEDIDDSIHLAVPKGCQKRQLVIQQSKFSEISKFTTRYVFNRLLLDKLDLENIAMTVIHEALFRLHLEQEAIDSRLTRFFNAYISSNPDVTVRDYLTQIENALAAGYIDSKQKELLVYIVPLPENVIQDHGHGLISQVIKPKKNAYWFFPESIGRKYHKEAGLHGYMWSLKNKNEVQFLARRINFSNIGWYDNNVKSFKYFTDSVQIRMTENGKIIQVLKYINFENPFAGEVNIFGPKIKQIKVFTNGKLEIKHTGFLYLYHNSNGELVKVCSPKFAYVEVDNKKFLKRKSGCVQIENMRITKYYSTKEIEVIDFSLFNEN